MCTTGLPAARVSQTFWQSLHRVLKLFCDGYYLIYRTITSNVSTDRAPHGVEWMMDSRRYLFAIHLTVLMNPTNLFFVKFSKYSVIVISKYVRSHDSMIIDYWLLWPGASSFISLYNFKNLFPFVVVLNTLVRSS